MPGSDGSLKAWEAKNLQLEPIIKDLIMIFLHWDHVWTGWTGWVECTVDIPETVMSTRAPVVLIIICIKNSLCVMAKSISQGKIEMNTRLILYSTLKNLQPVKKFLIIPHVPTFIDLLIYWCYLCNRRRFENQKDTAAGRRLALSTIFNIHLQNCNCK